MRHAENVHAIHKYCWALTLPGRRNKIREEKQKKGQNSESHQLEDDYTACRKFFTENVSTETNKYHCYWSTLLKRVPENIGLNAGDGVVILKKSLA